jgi:hypothetical protein
VNSLWTIVLGRPALAVMGLGNCRFALGDYSLPILLLRHVVPALQAKS